MNSDQPPHRISEVILLCRELEMFLMHMALLLGIGVSRMGQEQGGELSVLLPALPSFLLSFHLFCPPLFIPSSPFSLLTSYFLHDTF